MNVKIIALILAIVVFIGSLVYFTLGSTGIIDGPGLPGLTEGRLTVYGDVESTKDIVEISYEYDPGAPLYINLPPFAYASLDMSLVGELYDPISQTTANVEENIGRIPWGNPLPFTLVFNDFDESHSHFELTLTLIEHSQAGPCERWSGTFDIDI